VTQLISEYTEDDFVPGIATKARAAVPSSPSANTAMRLLLTGFITSDGSMTPGTISGPVTSEEQAAALAGVSSELARGFRAARLVSQDVEMWFGAVEEDAGGTQAIATATIGGSWTTGGEVVFYVDGDPLIVTVGASDSTSDVADTAVAEIDEHPGYSYTLANDAEVLTFTKVHKTTRGNSSILYVDLTGAPSGLTVTLEPPLAALLAIVNELRTDLLAHFALTAGSVHGAADSTSGAAVGSAATDHATALTLVNQLRTAYAAHRVLTAGSVHGAADSTNVVTLAAATTSAEAVALANMIKLKYNAHRVLTSGGVHGAADSTNVTTSDDAPTGAVTGDEDTGDGVRFAGGAGAEDVSDLIAAIEADPLWFKRITVSSLDTTNLGRWELFADTMNGPMIGKPSALALAHVGTQSAATAISKTQLNHEAFEVLWAYDAETPAFEIACAHAIDRVLVERNGPEGWNKSYSGAIYKWVKLARDKAKIAADHATQKSALQNGISPLTKTAAGEAMLVRAIWTRCQNADGSDNYLGLDVAEWTLLQETREMSANAWKYYRTKNPHVRDDFGKEPVVPAVATPTGFRTYLFSQVGRTLVDARCFETLPTLRASFNRITKRIQWELDYTRMPLHEQSEGIVTSLG